MKKRNLLTATLTALVFASGWTHSAQADTVMDVLAKSPNLSTATRLIQEAGLADTLRGPGPVTVFAPNNDAFAAMAPAQLTDISGNKETLKKVLSFHVLPASVMLDTVTNGMHKTSTGDSVSLYKSGTFLTVENAVVTQADMKASNGMVQVIDTVLTPPVKK